MSDPAGVPRDDQAEAVAGGSAAGPAGDSAEVVAGGITVVLEASVEIATGLAQATCDIANRTLSALGVADCEMTVVFSHDEALRDLNARYRGRDEATDVLSFPAAADATEPGGPRYLGDVIISVERARAQAAGGSPGGQIADAGPVTDAELGDELALLAVHGLLHLLGHEDDTEAGRARMEEQERALGVR